MGKISDFPMRGLKTPPPLNRNNCIAHSTSYTYSVKPNNLKPTDVFYGNILKKEEPTSFQIFIFKFFKNITTITYLQLQYSSL